MNKHVLFLTVWTALAMTPVAARAQHRFKYEQYAPVTSKAEFSRYLTAHSDFPLHKLPTEALENFVESLVFTPRGIGSYSYLGLSPRLTVSEIRQVLRVIGAEHTLASIPTLGRGQSSGAEGMVTAVMDNVCEHANSPLCEAGGGKTKTDSVCAASAWGTDYKCEMSFGDLCPSNCGK